MAVLTLALFGDTLIHPHRVPATTFSDLRMQYLPWRQFAFDQLRAGHFPLWNPYSFCGTPFFADPQSALLYPPNWLNYFLAPERAASWETVLHFFFAGFFAGLWCRQRGCGVIASIMAAVIYSCCGPIIANLNPGHLPLLFSATWAPLLLCCADGILSGDGRIARRWMLVGVPVVAMLALDGYPQFAYDSALVVGLYVLIQLPWDRRALKVIARMAVMFGLAWAVAGAQIIPSANLARESIRSGGMSYKLASDFSLPPENLLTLFVPGIFGDEISLPYYGRWFWWEACVFVGPAVFALAVYGAMSGRKMAAAAFMAAFLMLVALGSYTPLFHVLFNFVPGFQNFRAANRFALPSILFLALLAATGVDALGEANLRRRRKIVAIAMLVIAVIFGIGVIWAANAESNGPGDFSAIMRWLQSTGESGTLQWGPHPTFPAQAATQAARQFVGAAGSAALTALLFALSWKASDAGRRRAIQCAVGLAILAMGQLVLFAFDQSVRSDGFDPMPENWARAIALTPAEDRVLITSGTLAERGAAEGFLNVGGYNPLLLGRMGRFFDAVREQQAVIKYQLLRCSYVMIDVPQRPVVAMPNPLAHLELFSDWTPAATSDAALAKVLDQKFNPRQSLVLEQPPSPLPAAGPGPAGWARIVNQSVDDLEIEADLSRPQILLVTDAYSTGWRVMPLDETSQNSYSVLPADYCLRAIPLSAGHHHFRLEYRPESIRIGATVSAVSVAIYAVMWLIRVR
jgi:hypothetical protein